MISMFRETRKILETHTTPSRHQTHLLYNKPAQVFFENICDAKLSLSGSLQNMLWIDDDGLPLCEYTALLTSSISSSIVIKF